jgi:hypothetical protein
MSIGFHWFLGLVDLTSERVARISIFGEFTFALCDQYVARRHWRRWQQLLVSFGGIETYID